MLIYPFEVIVELMFALQFLDVCTMLFVN